MGILSSFLGGSNSSQKRENPDLMGSPNCPIGKKDDHGFTTYSCNFGCPMWHHCSRGSTRQW